MNPPEAWKLDKENYDDDIMEELVVNSVSIRTSVTTVQSTTFIDLLRQNGLHSWTKVVELQRSQTGSIVVIDVFGAQTILFQRAAPALSFKF